MNRILQTAIATAFVATAGAAQAGDEPVMMLAQTSAGNITQSQSGNTNSQSISIGSTDAKPAAKKGKKISSAQNDAETGNSQSANVSGSAKVKQAQDGRGNTQSADVDASGNISQNQSGRNNSQSISIGGGSGSSTGTPSLTQSQTGADRKKSVKIDGKKVE